MPSQPRHDAVTRVRRGRGQRGLLQARLQLVGKLPSCGFSRCVSRERVKQAEVMDRAVVAGGGDFIAQERLPVVIA